MQNKCDNKTCSPFLGKKIELSLKPKAMTYYTKNAPHPLSFIVVIKALLKHHLIAPGKHRFIFQNDHKSHVIQSQDWKCKLLDT